MRQFLFHMQAFFLLSISSSSCFSVQFLSVASSSNTSSSRRSFPSSRRSFPSMLNMSSSSGGTSDQKRWTANNAYTKKEEFLASVKSCSKAVLFSALIDSLSNYAALSSPNNSILSKIFAFLPALWKVGFAASIQYAARKYQKTGKIVVEDKGMFLDLCRTMALVWELTAWMTTAAVLFDTMNNFHCKWVVRAAGFAALGLGLVIRSTSHRETKRFEDNTETKTEGLKLTRSMALCAGALFMEAVLAPLNSFASDAHWAEKGFVLSGLPTPFVLAKLLGWDLRRSTLQAVVATTTSTETTTDQNPILATYSSLLEAQNKFYAEAASMFRAENIFKVVFFFLMVVKTQDPPLSKLVNMTLVITILLLSS